MNRKDQVAMTEQNQQQQTQQPPAGGGQGQQQPPAQQPPATGGQGQQGQPGADESVIQQAQHPDAVRNLIDSEREARRQAEQRAQEAERKVQEAERAGMTAEERAKAAADDKAATEATTAENLRLRVALKKGLTGDKAALADRLKGSTEAELEADADQLLAMFNGDQGQQPPPGSPPAGGVRAPAGEPLSMDDRIRRAGGRG